MFAVCYDESISTYNVIINTFHDSCNCKSHVKYEDRSTCNTSYVSQWTADKPFQQCSNQTKITIYFYVIIGAGTLLIIIINAGHDNAVLIPADSL